MNPKQIIQAFVDAINSQDWIKLDSLVAPDFVRHIIAAGEPPVRSRTDLVSFLRREYQAFPDAQETTLDIFAECERLLCVTISLEFNALRWVRIRPAARP